LTAEENPEPSFFSMQSYKDDNDDGSSSSTSSNISKALRQYHSNILGKHKNKEIQKTAIFGSAHKLRKVLM